MAIRQAESIPRRFHGLLEADRVAEVSDAELLARFTAERDAPAEIAFTSLVHRHGPMVFRVCRQILGDRHIAEDAFQATFLILARRAGSIHRPELLGHWLHGVAFRTAREARMREHRRQRRECALFAAGSSADPVDRSDRPDLSSVCREEFEALHEEVSRLPEKYRVPVVLCDLEGLTYQDAALRLGCPVGTIGVRLRRARERLRVRMTRRGLAPTAGLLVTLLASEAASACPPLLVDSTVKAAMGFAASSTATAGLASTPVIALSEKMLRVMAFSRVKAAVHLALAVVISAALGWLAAPHRVKTQGAPLAAASGLTGTLIPPGQPTAPDQTRPQAAAETVPAGAEIALARTDRAIADQPKRDGPQGVPALPEDVFAGVQPANDQTANDLHATTAKPAFDPAEDALRVGREERARGELLFTREWVANDPRNHGGDGLGPVYNETSCVACHGLGAPGGAGPESKNVVLITAAQTGCGPPVAPDKVHPGFRGSPTAVLHRFGTDPEYASWLKRFYRSNGNGQSNVPASRRDDSVSGRIQALKDQTAPERRLRERTVGQRSMNGLTVNISERNTPPLFGVGLIDEIPSEVLVAVAARQPAAIRGRVNRTTEGRIGRFGSKAQVPTLHEFVRGACANELGLEVPGHSQGASPLDPNTMPKGLDLTEPECDDLVAYVRALPAPAVVDPSGLLGTKDMRVGRKLFAQVNCTACHVPTLGSVDGIFSDLLLHNMGQSLSDAGSPYGGNRPDSPEVPGPREWRTPPLWGYRDSGPYLHDGRAQNLEEAVALHEGQAKASAHQFFKLSSKERAQVESFLKSLVAPGPAGATGFAQTRERASSVEPDDAHAAAETLVRRQREFASARDEEQFRADLRRRHAQVAAKRARAQIPLARSLEKMGKISGALEFYQAIAREATGTKEGRLAESRISELNKRNGSP